MKLGEYTSKNRERSHVFHRFRAFLVITPEINPLYTRADFYFPLNNLGELRINGSNITAGLGRAELGLYPAIHAQDSYVEIANFTDGCLSEPARCPRGFSLAFWLKLKRRPRDMLDGVIFTTAGPLNRERVGINIYLSSRSRLAIEGEIVT